MTMLARAWRLFTSSRDFSLLMLTQFAAQAGDGVVQAALAKLIVFGGQKGFDLEGARSPDELLRIALYLFVPYTIVSPFLGVLIDRWDRRRLLFAVNALRAGVVALVGVAGTGAVGDVPLFLAFLLTLASTRVVLATKAAALPVTVARESLVEANAVSQLGGAMFQLAGAGAAVIAARFLPVEPIVLTGAAVYAAGALAAGAMRQAGEHAVATLREAVARVLSNIAAGVREVVRKPRAGAAIVTYFWLRALWSLSIVAIGFVARSLLADQEMQVLLLTGGAGAAGAGLGFLAARVLHDRVRSTAHLVLAAATLAGLAVLVLGGLRLRGTIALLTFALGFGFFLAKISLDTLVQQALGDDFRGRAFSLYDIAYNLAWVVAAATMKLLWTAEGEGSLLAGTGMAFLAGVALLAGWYARAGLLVVPAARRA